MGVLTHMQCKSSNHKDIYNINPLQLKRGKMYIDTNKHLKNPSLTYRNNIVTTILQTDKSMQGIYCFF